LNNLETSTPTAKEGLDSPEAAPSESEVIIMISVGEWIKRETAAKKLGKYSSK
jgi:hypothetical protein